MDTATDDRQTGDTDEARVADEPVHVESLLADLRALSADVDSPEGKAELGHTKRLLRLASARGLVDSRVRRLDTRDAAEAVVGSVVFASPLLVEDGLFDIARHLFSTRVAGVPLYLLCNVAFVVVMTYALVEWTGRDRTDAHRFAGVLPARVLMILAVSFVTAAVMLTVWGRVEGWREPDQALARVSVLWAVGSIGAALGDLVAEGSPGAPAPAAGDDGSAPAEALEGAGVEATRSHRELVAELTDQFDSAHAAFGDESSRRELRRIEADARQATADDLFGDHISSYTTRDVAEASSGVSSSRSRCSSRMASTTWRTTFSRFRTADCRSCSWPTRRSWW